MTAGDLSHIPVAILAGGLGTRLRPAIGDRPKALADVAGRPFLAWLLDQVARFGFRDVVLCTGWRGEQVEAALGERFGVSDVLVPASWRLRLDVLARGDGHVLYSLR